MRSAETDSKKNGEILVVDDTPEAAVLLTQILLKAGYVVHQVSDGEAALCALNARLPDLLLLDVCMPGMDGFEVCRRLKADAMLASVPVIFLSASDAVEDKVKGLKLGAVDYITKPHQPEEVLARVHTHITLSRLQRELVEERERLDLRVKERTAALERQTQEMESILHALDLAGDGIVKVGPDGRIHYANRTLLDTIGLADFKQMLGRRLEEMLVDGEPIISFLQMAELRRAVARSGQWQGELLLKRGGGQDERRLLAHVRTLPDQGRVTILTDITDARRREEQQLRLEQELKQARRLESLGQLASGVAHDFNNLLGAILGFAQFIAEDTEDEAPQHRYAQRIIRAGQQAKALIGQIMAFSQRRETVSEPIDLVGMLNENTSILRAVVAASTELAVNVPDTPMVVAGQRNQLVQILMNLVVNGSEALAGAAGTVTVDVFPGDGECTDISPLFPASDSATIPVNSDSGEASAASAVLWRDDDGWFRAALGRLIPGERYIVLRVTDSGCGMDMETLSGIFTPFFTTKAAAGGSGLGLAVVHGAVTAHQGGILVTTAPGRGSRFDIVLPETADQAPLVRQEIAVATPIRQRGSILLVDDSTHFGDMLMTALFRLGYEISACDDPLEAIEFIKEDPGAWDLLITDQVMMHMTGLELVAAVKRIRADLPCIVCTAFPAGITEEAARESGADGFATKPLDLGKFSMLVQEILATNPLLDVNICGLALGKWRAF